MSSNRSIPSAEITRRDILKASAIAASGAALGVAADRSAAAADPAARKRALRLAHLTDIHIQPELAADQGMIACLRHLQALADKPELILFGGDCVMDSFAEGVGRTQTQWDLWHKVLLDECSLPFESCIGNHDIWGWDKAKSMATGDEPLFGKAWAMDGLGLDRRYRSFDRAGWHFIALDSTHVSETPGEYVGRLDEEQFAWLAADLAATPVETPILVFSHIPILSASVFFDGENETGENWHVPGAWMHIDARRIKDLFLKHKNVKVCLSGHLHLVDRVDYLGVAYVCNGAVSGNWWKGDHQECDEGYAVVDLFDDGSFESEYLGFGWMPRE